MTIRPAAEITGMTGSAALPRRNGELVFEAPWQGRALGMALAVVERLELRWAEFQRRLIEEIAVRPEVPYWEAWLAALERLVVEHGAASSDELERHVKAVLIEHAPRAPRPS
jgi:nitrile hydratase accessory protein